MTGIENFDSIILSPYSNGKRWRTSVWNCEYDIKLRFPRMQCCVIAIELCTCAHQLLHPSLRLRRLTGGLEEGGRKGGRGPRPIFVDPYQASKHSEEQFKKVISGGGDRRTHGRTHGRLAADEIVISLPQVPPGTHSAQPAAADRRRAAPLPAAVTTFIALHKDLST